MVYNKIPSTPHWAIKRLTVTTAVYFPARAYTMGQYWRNNRTPIDFFDKIFCDLLLLIFSRSYCSRLLFDMRTTPAYSTKIIQVI